MRTIFPPRTVAIDAISCSPRSTPLDLPRETYRQDVEHPVFVDPLHLHESHVEVGRLVDVAQPLAEAARAATRALDGRHAGNPLVFSVVEIIHRVEIGLRPAGHSHHTPPTPSTFSCDIAYPRSLARRSAARTGLVDVGFGVDGDAGA